MLIALVYIDTSIFFIFSLQLYNFIAYFTKIYLLHIFSNIMNDLSKLAYK